MAALAGAQAALAYAVPRSTLVHEHILVDFIGADLIKPGRYNPDEVFRVARPKLEELARQGCRRLLECTPNFLGRDPRLLARLSDAVGIEIWTNTGLYGAGAHKFLPGFARQETAEQLARRWIEETRQGIDGVQPRFVKIGVNQGPLHEWDRKLVRAAAITSRETGMTVASHTGDRPAALGSRSKFSPPLRPPQRGSSGSMRKTRGTKPFTGARRGPAFGSSLTASAPNRPPGTSSVCSSWPPKACSTKP